MVNLGQMKIKHLIASCLATASCGTTPIETVHTASISNAPPVFSQPPVEAPPAPSPSTEPSSSSAKPCSYADNDCETSCQNTDPVSGCTYTCTCNANNKTECEVACPSGACPPEARQNFVCKSTKETHCYFHVGSCVCDFESTQKWQCMF